MIATRFPDGTTVSNVSDSWTAWLSLANGKSLRVRHPGELNLIPYEHIVRIEFLPRKSAKAA